MIWTMARSSLICSANIDFSTYMHSVCEATLGMPEGSVRQCFVNTSARRSHVGEPLEDSKAQATPQTTSDCRCGAQAPVFWKLFEDSNYKQFVDHCRKEMEYGFR